MRQERGTWTEKSPLPNYATPPGGAAVSIIERLSPWSRDRAATSLEALIGQDPVRASLQEVVRRVDRRVVVVAVGRPGTVDTGDVVADIVMETARSVGRRAILPDRDEPEPTELVGVPVGHGPGPDVVVLRVPEGLEDDVITSLQTAMRAEVQRVQPFADPAARWTIVGGDPGLLTSARADERASSER